MFIHNATIAIVVYSVTDKCSFESVDFWLQRLKDHADAKAIKFLVVNKADIDKKRKATVEEGRKKTNSNNEVFCEVNVKNRLRINKLFSAISKEYAEKEVEMPSMLSLNIDVNYQKNTKDVIKL
jgi:GTPase SAR1 family protein